MAFKVLFLSFILSFCSLLYELIFAKALGLATDNLILAQTCALGFYFLGMGLGSSRKIPSEHKNSFFRTEIFLSLLGIASPILIYIVYFLFHLLVPSLKAILVLPILLSIPFFVGFYTGKEFLHLMKYGEHNGVSVNYVLATTYFGNLAAGLIFPVYIYPAMGVFGSSFLGSSINLIAALIIFFEIKSIRNFTAIAASSLFFLLVGYNISNINTSLLSLSYTSVSASIKSFSDIKNIYYYTKETAPIAQQLRSKYQDIDILTKNNDYTLLLNRKPQFSSDNYKAYHLSMIKGFLNLHPEQPKNILILGGGDGILARYLLEEDISSITLVDLDPYILNLAKKHSNFTRLNHGSLHNPKVKIINGDAFTFLMTETRKFDAVFIDFPLPNYLELSKLYSTEFYSLVLKSLSPKGGAIFDSPVHFKYQTSPEKFTSSGLRIIQSTLNASQIYNFTGFGPHENFIYFNKPDIKRSFNYEQLEEDLSNRVLVNLIENEFFLNTQISEKRFVNSIFKPLRFPK